jgi:hypothetical protein
MVTLWTEEREAAVAAGGAIVSVCLGCCVVRPRICDLPQAFASACNACERASAAANVRLSGVATESLVRRRRFASRYLSISAAVERNPDTRADERPFEIPRTHRPAIGIVSLDQAALLNRVESDRGLAHAEGGEHRSLEQGGILRTRTVRERLPEECAAYVAVQEPGLRRFAMPCSRKN